MESIGNANIIMNSCPITKHGNIFVTTSSSGSEQGEFYIKFYKFDSRFPTDPIKLISSVKVTAFFTSLAWTKFGEDTEEHSYGFLIGGHADGSVSLWAASAIIQSSENRKPNFGLLQFKKLHNSSVNCIKINQKPSLFATASNEIVIINMDKLTLEPSIKCPAKDEGVIKSIMWNDKIFHILAAASSTGIIYVWEMKKVELFLTICDQGIFHDGDDSIKKEQYINTHIAWCNDGVQLIIAYDHPEYNFLTQYHMKMPNAPSAEYHGGHQEPIIDIAKNQCDNNLLLSLGRENVATCWSIRTQKPLVHINFNTGDKKVSSIMWLNKTPDVFISATLDGEINYHQVNFSGEFSNSNTLKELTEAPPKWLMKKSGVCFSFGGKFATFSEKSAPNITIHALSGNSQLSAKTKAFIENIEKSDLNEVLDEKINSSIQSKEKNSSLFWIALKSCYTNNYNELFRAMGYDKAKLQKEVYTYIGKKVETPTSKKERQKVVNVNLIDTNEAEDFWSTFAGSKNDKESGEMKNTENAMTALEKPHTITDTITKNINWSLGTEKLIKQSLLIGDLQSAVDVALKCGRDAEALLIASAGDKDLFDKTKQAFFNKNKDLFIKNIFSSIINGDFASLLDYNVLKDWKEYILYARTYLEGNAFTTFANNLGDRISSNPDIYMALVCYILGHNYDKCVELLYNNYVKEIDKLNRNQKKLYLHHLFEQVIAIKNVLKHNVKNDLTEKIMANYCELLINEGLFEEACTYLMKLKNNDSHILTLYDRLYNHCDLKVSGKFVKIPPPFNVTVVKPKVEKKIVQNLNVKGAPINTVSKPVNLLSQQIPKQDLFEKPLIGPSHTMNPNKSPFGQVPSNPVMNKPTVQAPTPMINKPPVKMQNIETPQVIDNRNEVPQYSSNVPNTVSNQSQGQPNMVAQPIKKIGVGIKPINPPMPFNKKTSVEEKVNEPVPNLRNLPSSNAVPSYREINKPQPVVNKIEASNRFPSPVSTKSAEKIIAPMNQDEETAHNSFEKYLTLYNSVYPDENKQKDFNQRVVPLLVKLRNHELKITLVKLLIEFINLFESGAGVADLKKIYLKIQSNGWDQNKNWMSCMEKLINMPRK